MDQFLQAETLVIELLLIISLVAIAVQRLQHEGVISEEVFEQLAAEVDQRLDEARHSSAAGEAEA